MTPTEDPRDRVAVAILTAQDELTEALQVLEAVPVAEATHVRLAANSLEGTTFASIAVSQGTFFIRSDTHLYRIGKK